VALWHCGTVAPSFLRFVLGGQKFWSEKGGATVPRCHIYLFILKKNNIIIYNE
tara:strand:+ start:6822 stop:6980 length:159 start_codon:yes stop_codon:yes gene_type:complete